MEEIFCKPNERIAILTTQEIIELHSILCNNYDLLSGMEPVSPAGVKNKDMLESAVSRQWVGSGDYYKYSTIYSNCATLVFGLVKNHAFHNGNKRIGFLALLKHMYNNGYVIKANVKHEEIFELLRTLANNDLFLHAKSFLPNFFKVNYNREWNQETDILYMAYWLKNNTEHKSRKIKQKTISISELSGILTMKNLDLAFSGKYLTINKKQSFFQSLLNKKGYKKEYIIKDAKSISLNMVEQIREDFSLSFHDGVDNVSFYNNDDILNEEIKSYKKIIYKLSKT